MCKAHSKVTHIKQQKYFHHLKGRGYNDTLVTAKWSKSKPEVKCQYGGRLYFETGSSYISAAN